MPKERTLNIDRERAMIMDESRWPCWPLLPVKNTVLKEPDVPAMGLLGVIVAGKPNEVIIGNMFMITDESPKKTYPSIEVLLRDGWIVD